jgi:hypothetical protein
VVLNEVEFIGRIGKIGKIGRIGKMGSESTLGIDDDSILFNLLFYFPQKTNF